MLQPFRFLLPINDHRMPIFSEIFKSKLNNNSNKYVYEMMRSSSGFNEIQSKDSKTQKNNQHTN